MNIYEFMKKFNEELDSSVEESRKEIVKLSKELGISREDMINGIIDKAKNMGLSKKDFSMVGTKEKDSDHFIHASKADVDNLKIYFDSHFSIIHNQLSCIAEDLSNICVALNIDED